jgi:hypothetical protein
MNVALECKAVLKVRESIDSISLNPDTVLKTTAAILQREEKLMPA